MPCWAAESREAKGNEMNQPRCIKPKPRPDSLGHFGGVGTLQGQGGCWCPGGSGRWAKGRGGRAKAPASCLLRRGAALLLLGQIARVCRMSHRVPVLPSRQPSLSGGMRRRGKSDAEILGGFIPSACCFPKAAPGRPVRQCDLPDPNASKREGREEKGG